MVILHALFSRGRSTYHCHLRTQDDGGPINKCSIITLSEGRECGDRSHDLKV